MEEKINCLNCRVEVYGNFCSNCGQRGDLTPIRFKDLGSDFLSSLVNYDAPFPRTLGNLFVRPGKLIREYLEGRRKTYFAAVRYLILCLAISVLVTKVFDYDPVMTQLEAKGISMENRSSDVSLFAGEFLHKNINYFIFLFPFVIGLISKLFYWKWHYNYAERTAVGFFISAQFLIISSIMVPLMIWMPKLFRLNNFLVIAYITFAFYNFFQPKRKFLGILQSLLAAVTSYFIYIFIAFLLAIAIIKTFDINTI